MLAGVSARLRSLWRSLRHRGEVESEMREELLLHIEMHTEALMQAGLSRREAERRARIEFGSLETVKEEARESRGVSFFDEIRFSWLDVKLGLRMLFKHPGLTCVATFTLAVGIPVGMAPMHLSGAIEAPLPVAGGERIRAIRFWNVETRRPQSGTFYDLARVRAELTSFDAVGASRSEGYNLAAQGAVAAPVLGAQVTASTFEILNVRPFLGRVLRPADEKVGAPRVALLGYSLWWSRFGGDPAVVGTTVRVGRVPHRVVGVMPEGFLFPVAQQLWLPLSDEADAQPGQGVGLRIFGRMSRGIGPDEARAEVAVFGERLADQLPETHQRLAAEVVPFGFSYLGLEKGGLAAMPEFYFFQFLALGLLFVACGNVSMLIFARTATRSRELAVRTALGAGRGRLVSQMFVESFVLAVGAAGLGLLSVEWLLGRLRGVMAESGVTVPYWLDLGVTWEAAVWALGLAVVSAAVAGIVPALRVTGRKVQRSLKATQSGGSGIRFGRVTSALVIADVAIAVTVLGFALGLSDRMKDAWSSEDLVGIPAEEYLAVQLRLSSGNMTNEAGGVDEERLTRRLAATQQALLEELESEPGVLGVALADVLPRMDHRTTRVEMDGDESAGLTRRRTVRFARVDIGFFDALEQPILHGRGFDRVDLDEHRSTVIVNSGFVDRELEGRNPVGRRVRLLSAAGTPGDRWYEIVGVVGHLGMNIVNPEGEAGIYFPADHGEIHPFRLGIHVGASPESFVPRLRELLEGVDPEVVVGPPVVLNRVYQGDWYLGLAMTGGLVLLVGILVALAASALYAMMSFSVSQRTREIGIRTALGARREMIVGILLRRSLFQMGAGTLLGMPLAGWFFVAFESGLGSTRSAFAMALATGAGVMALIGLVSCVAPARRALRIEPSEALRVE